MRVRLNGPKLLSEAQLEKMVSIFKVAENKDLICS